MDAALAALRKVDFSWTAHLDEIWSERSYESAQLQAELRMELEERVADLVEQSAPASPLGIPMLGSAGSGKTHLLGVLRRHAVASGAYFILADMTDVSDFWETVSLGFLRSLQQVPCGQDKRQVDRWLESMIQRFGKRVRKVQDIPKQRPPGLINRADELINQVRAKYPAETQEHTDVLRALILFACDHSDVNDLGYKWLQGLEIDADELSTFGFRQCGQKPSRIVRGLSWLLSLTAGTVLALDQLDAIVAEHELARLNSNEDTPDEALVAQRQVSLSIIQGIARGLLDLRDVTRRTLTVVSSLEATWEILDQQATVSMVDRYEEKILLKPSASTDIYKDLVGKRLQAAYEKQGFTPPYPTYPYNEAFFGRYRRNTPRELLKACEAHRKACKKAHAVTETNLDREPDPDNRIEVFARVRQVAEMVQERIRDVDVSAVLTDDSEQLQDRLVEVACSALVAENPLKEGVFAKVDKDFMGTGSYDPLHARIRLIFTEQREREKHHSFRFLEKTHYRAFQARLKAAMTASGIDEKLTFRGLTILRRAEAPKGAATQKLLDEVCRRGGRVVSPGDDELATLLAFESLMAEEPEHFEEWLALERPVSKMPSFAHVVDALFNGAVVSADEPTGHVPPKDPSPDLPEADASEPERKPPNEGGGPGTGDREPPMASGLPLLIGRRQREPRDEVGIPLDRLPYHTCVLAGSGSGKTVFLKRVIEEAALRGIPSIVLDGANDLSRLGTQWPSRPDVFSDEDAAKASQYHERSEVVVWTPGAPLGNPMCLSPLPDFNMAPGLSDAEHEAHLDATVDLAVSSISAMIMGKGRNARKQEAIVRRTLRYFARRGGSLREFAALLQEPPEEAISSYEKGEQMARELGELLYAEIENDPLLGEAGTPLDPSVLLRASSKGKTRVSVVNLVGLPDYAQKRRFVDQLASALFSWIKKNPAPPGGLLGLLVIDEAKDFVPSGTTVPGKDNLLRLAAQARKYGLGLLFATQEPKSIDHKVVANCSTLLGGRMNSPASIGALQQLLADKGAHVKDVATLKPGEFYFSSGAAKPYKIRTSLCLSAHPSTPPGEAQVLECARQSVAS